MTRPLCRYCGKPIAKKTRIISFSDKGASTIYWTVIDAKPRSKEEAQRLVNEQIVSVKWTRGEEYAARQAGFDYIHSVTTWDGESYTDPYFCNGNHAQGFAYMIAAWNPQLGSEDYEAAVKQRASAQPETGH